MKNLLQLIYEIGQQIFFTVAEIIIYAGICIQSRQFQAIYKDYYKEFLNFENISDHISKQHNEIFK